MENIETHWSYQEFLVYVLLYAANADLDIKPEERELIVEKVDTTVYASIKKEFNKDNDYWQLEKIKAYCKLHLTEEEAKNRLFKDIEELLWSDGEFSAIEKSFFRALKRILD